MMQMKETLSVRNKLLAGALAGALALAGCGGGGTSSLSHESGGIPSPKQEAGKTATIPKVPELQVGDSIHSVRLINVGPSKNDKRITLRSDSSRPEDLGVVYNPDLSASLLGTMGDTDPDHAVGILLTENAGQTSFSFIFFEQRSGEIAHISSSAALKQGPQELFGFGEGSKYYQVTVDPAADGEVIVSCSPGKL